MNFKREHGITIECWGGPDDGLVQWVPSYRFAVLRFREGEPIERMFSCPSCPAPIGALGIYKPVVRQGKCVLAWTSLLTGAVNLR
jgi:hypothetical protein